MRHRGCSWGKLLAQKLIKHVHGTVGAEGDESPYGLDGMVEGGVEGLEFIVREAAEDVVDLVSLAEIVAYADAKAAIVGCMYQLLNAFKSVVAAVGALLLHTDFAYGEGDVVDNDEKIFDRHLLFLHPELDGLAGEVHIGGGANKDEGTAFDLYFSTIGMTFEDESRLLPFFGCNSLEEAVYNHEAAVVACAFVFGAYIAEANDKIFHFRIFSSMMGSGLPVSRE